MGKEDQQEELEILESIYPEELEVLDEDNLAVHLNLETEPVKYIKVEVQYTPDYPETAPLITISKEVIQDETSNKDEGQDEEEERRFDYDFTPADCRTLMDHANEVAEENLGIVSVFTIMSSIKETAEELFESRIKDQEAARLAQLNLEEEKEQAKFKGTPVTKESFAAWREKFRAEKGLDKPKERPFGRYTGKEIFVKGIYKEEDEEEAENQEEEEED